MACPPQLGGAGGSAASRAQRTIGEILRKSLPDYSRTHRLPAQQWKVLNALSRCRTAALGGHLYRCGHCGGEHFAPHSCRNRHCPACQGANSQQWLAKQQQTLLPIPYFHLVFTLPHALNALIAQNQAPLYNLLFAAASETLLQFGRQKFAAQLGLTAVLHTWGQTLVDHYHLHGIASGGGLTTDRTGWVKSHPRYLFAVAALSKVFRAKFCLGLQRLYADGQLQFHGQLQPLAEPAAFQRLVRAATATDWVVYSKRPFAGPEQVLAYLSRYTHRVGISNGRILAFDPDAATVTFGYRDYADRSRSKSMTLSSAEFVRRLRRHILPARFVKIRHYGLLANRGRQTRIAAARRLLGQPDPPAEIKTNAIAIEAPASAWACPHCGKRELVLVRVVQPPRGGRPGAALDSS
jgi:DNA-directed RNA polymerase subunit RPC12/RpoP